jgi:NTP pyrophosphatase (non-canonical NTP hydrolase)
MTRSDILKLKKIKTTTEAFGVFRYLGRVNTKKYNLAKLAEELNELSDVCLKLHNKKPDRHPSKQALIDEIGDVQARIRILMTSLGVSRQDIVKRHLHKANKYIGYIKKNKYGRGI